MRINESGRVFIRQSRLGKRISQDPDGSVSSKDSPLLVDSPPAAVTPTPTVLLDPSGETTSPFPPSSSPEVFVTATDPPPAVTPSIPNGTGKNSGKNSDDLLTGTSPRGMPVGTIVGIVLAILIALAAVGVFFFFRRRSMQRRMKTRGWVNNKNAPVASSFLFLDDKSCSKGVNVVTPFASPRAQFAKDFTYPKPPPPTFSSYQTMNNGLPYIPPPMPPRPPPAQGYEASYSVLGSPTQTIPVTVPPTRQSAGTEMLSPQSTTSRFQPSRVSVSILSPLTPGTMPPMPTLPSPQPLSPSQLTSPMTFTQPVPLPSVPEIVKIKSTFIPTLPDELTIVAGELVRVKKEFDDGWTLCVNSKGEQGMIPLECLDYGRSLESKKSARASSLAGSGIY